MESVNFLLVLIVYGAGKCYIIDVNGWSGYDIRKCEVCFFMTAIRQEAIKMLEKVPEDKLGFVIQVMQGVNGLYNDEQSGMVLLGSYFL